MTEIGTEDEKGKTDQRLAAVESVSLRKFLKFLKRIWKKFCLGFGLLFLGIAKMYSDCLRGSCRGQGQNGPRYPVVVRIHVNIPKIYLRI